jgi:hypothetical protein
MRKILLLLLLLTACQFGGVMKAPPPKEIPIFTGTNALEASFNPASMSSMIMCQQADMFVDIKNTGTSDIADGVYSFITEDQYLLPLSERMQKFSLSGKSQFNPKGEFDQVHFRVKNIGILPQFESYQPDLVFRACYKYSTFASAQVCIDPDITNLNPRKVCRSQPVVLSGGQGAPVAVTRIEPYMVPDGNQVRPVFAVFVQNLGMGTVVTTQGAELACTGGSGPLLTNNATVRVSIQDKLLSCTPNPVKVESGREFRFICEHNDLLFGESSGTFNTILSIQLDYGYVNSAILPMTITRLPGQEACK